MTATVLVPRWDTRLLAKVQIDPESRPLTPEDREYLVGFLRGLATQIEERPGEEHGSYLWTLIKPTWPVSGPRRGNRC